MSYPLRENRFNMNTKNESLTVADGRVGKKLESLPEEKRQVIMELAGHTRLIDMVEILKEHGIDTSRASLSRFLREHREREVLEEGEQMRGAVEALASRGQGENLRKGTMEALRQKMYDLALTSNDAEAARELYRDILKEEAKIKELQLEERKAAALEEQVKLQRLRIEVQARAIESKGAQRAKVIVESAPVVAGELPGPSEREFVEEHGKGLTGGNRENGDEKEERKKLAALTSLWTQMGEILNRGGRSEEKVVEARDVWEEGRRMLL
jgi:hypothetical protein